jgi:hypothetical protein
MAAISQFTPAGVTLYASGLGVMVTVPSISLEHPCDEKAVTVYAPSTNCCPNDSGLPVPGKVAMMVVV